MKKFALAFSIVMLASYGVSAASIPAACEAAKQQSAGSLRQCLHGAERQLVVSGDPAAHGAAVAKCASKFSALWQKAEQKAVDKGSSCTSTGDEGDVQDSIAAEVACLTSALATGDGTCLTCGDGVIGGDGSEQCDLGTLGGATCATASGGSRDFGTLACTADCGFDTSGCKDCPGHMVDGFCWVLGGGGASCSTICSALGLGYDTATSFYAGHGGNNANCKAVLDALGAPGSGVTFNAPNGVGCGVYFGSRYRAPWPTTAAESYPTFQRACACK